MKRLVDKVSTGPQYFCRSTGRFYGISKKQLKKYLEFFKKTLYYTMIYRNNTLMSKIRDAILKEMKKSGLTIYRISKMVEGKVPQCTVYDFLSGKTDASTKVAAAIMDALGLKITTKSKKRKREG